jgi:hypothetical protein
MRLDGDEQLGLHHNHPRRQTDFVSKTQLSAQTPAKRLALRETS